ncbi:hypothetical protein HK099_008294 [Clydaea vesicula]|uniref:Uncharacterized protein n=1 Tax=Clydaea vesicula TaxID=447962 RepID=A0AAD5XZG6_9FUNG|nr:hypothetical protein HK099_008294 [Clydaea vesicula]KAJ3397163.1 hypothetical protein HDU92_000468 [Lobulomyces angularis]
MEKQSLLENQSNHHPVLPNKKRVRNCKVLKTSLFLVVLTALITLISFPNVLVNLKNDLVRVQSWEKFTAVGSTVVNEKYHFVWRNIWDQQSSKFRIDALALKHDKGDSDVDLNQRIKMATDFLIQGNRGESIDQDLIKSHGGPVTILYDNGGFYGIYAKDDKPACRHYSHEIELPNLNPLDGAKFHGVQYVHKIFVADKYTNLNLPRHEHDKGPKESSLWIESFSKKPLAAEGKGKVEKNGKKYDLHVFHTFYKFGSWVDSSQLTLPESIEEICVDGGKGDGLRDISIELPHFSEFLSSLDIM